ncbi:hypothetical protein [Sporosarcina sp. ACRSL]|uniref:hypothetical protein n=1 Tax=Sporosarcina sp. ACRSL TaxID=2918215 RepID=UPI001EF66F04|nr:hypothetical protein [Sporosarcina sp. ACRSL]
MINKTLEENSSLEEQLNTAFNDFQLTEDAANDFPIYSYDELLQINYTGTKEDVIKELMEYSHLIPYESIADGMEFIQEEAQILSHEWAFMPFGDGVTGGYLLLKFRVDGDTGHYPSHIEVIDSYLHGEGFKQNAVQVSMPQNE